MTNDQESLGLRSSPAALRNRQPIADVLEGFLPDSGRVLMVAEGSGEHAVYFARRFPHLQWLPTDRDEEALASIAAYRAAEKLDNLAAPTLLDAASGAWPSERVEAILCINMIHISPWSATIGLMEGASRNLAGGGHLYLYGPFLRDGVATAPSNLAFDESLKMRNPDWGIRRLDDVVTLAKAKGLTLEDVVEMPANNLSVVFQRNNT
jgi:hypothetical protein|tara:strand:+ start:93564 stop:94187 length:624 start_codon:yes stop_codon:yes gene_type:complete